MGLFENMKAEPVSRLALRRPVLTRPDETIAAAIQRMREAKLGCAIVVDEDRKPQGILTESIVTQLVATKPSAISEPVSNYAADQCPYVELTDPIYAILEAMEAKNVRFLCVVDDQGRVTGLTGQKGLMEYVAEHFPGDVMVQRVGQKPSYHTREGA